MKLKVGKNIGILYDMPCIDFDDEYYEILNSKELYCIFSGLSYTKIGAKFYGRNTNKFIYRIRKLMKQLHVCNRRQLAYVALKQHLVTLDKVMEYKNA